MKYCKKTQKFQKNILYSANNEKSLKKSNKHPNSLAYSVSFKNGELF